MCQKFTLLSLTLLLTFGLLGDFLSDSASAAERPVDFNQQIRPILSDKCFQCHGPDVKHQDSELRFNTEESAKQDLGGYFAIVPGKPKESTLVDRILSHDEDQRMPPEDSGKELTPEQISLLKRWIAEGAEWAPHWAYVTPKKLAPSKTAKTDWNRNWIDSFILERLEREKLQPAPDANRVTLIRRLSFDLTGLPPTSEEVEAFLKDKSDSAYEKVVDRLLASPHYGERMAIWWLDLVRYADTVGYHGDQEHRIWPYRDYVISAFNKNMPFDQFTREQLSGDLLENPNQSQRVATGYNRLLQTSHEGGLQLKEYRVIYLADRVRNFSQVWMGATMGCAQCHDHKYDPYTMNDFYSMAAFFADIDDEDHLRRQGTIPGSPTSRKPEMKVYTDEQLTILAKIEPKLKPTDPDRQKLQHQINHENHQIGVFNNQIKASDKKLAEIQAKPEKDEKLKAEQKKLADLKTVQTKSRDTAVAKRDGLQEKYNKLAAPIADLIKQRKAIRDSAPVTMITKPLAKPRIVRVLARGSWLDESGPAVQPTLPAFLNTPIVKNHDETQNVSTSENEKQSEPKTLTRLDLANWLTKPRSQGGTGEFTARVQVNRFWQLLTGSGLARVLDDFGGQGDPPVHPELLDQLAIEFFESGWDVKHMMKLIAMSHTYQQSSVARPELHEIDPDNRLYARQTPIRIPAESIRDNALAISGLLVRDLGGVSVKPYQPVGYYSHLNFPFRKYTADTDSRQWRRGLYVHWQRQFLHPMLKAFDAASREECTAQRPVSNTPTAALALLNDPTFVETARVFAQRIMKEGGSNDAERLRWAFQNATSRKPTEEESAILSQLLAKHRIHFKDHSEEAKKILQSGMTPADASLDTQELAAWTSVARAILNLNEVITRN